MKKYEGTLIKLLKNNKSKYKDILDNTTKIKNHYERFAGNDYFNNMTKMFYEFFDSMNHFEENMKNSNSVYAFALIVDNMIENLSSKQSTEECITNVKSSISSLLNYILDENIKNKLNDNDCIKTIILTNNGKNNALSLLFQKPITQDKKMKGGKLNNNIITIISIIVLIVVVVIIVVLVIRYIKKKEVVNKQSTND